MKLVFNKAIFGAVLALSMVMAGPAMAQTGAPPATAPGDSEAGEEKQPAEEFEPGTGKISEFGETLGQFWSVQSSFQGTQSFDDNVFLANNFRKSDTVSKLAGRITVAYRGKHTRYEASYLPEFNIYQRYETFNYSSHAYFQTLTHDFTRRLKLNWRTSVYRSPSRGNLPFKLVNFGFFSYTKYSPEALQDGVNLLNGSNSVGLSYRWTPRITVTGSLDGAATHFSDRGNPTVSLITKDIIYSAGAKLGLSYALNAAQSVGVSLGSTYFSSISRSGAIGTSDHHHYESVKFTYNHRLPNKFAFSAAVGPSVTLRSGAAQPQVDVHFDVGLSRQLERSSYAVAFQRTSQVGLLQDSITGYGVNGRVYRSMGRKWRTNLGGAYMRSEGTSGLHSMESAGGNAQIAYQLTQKMTPYINYGYTHQKALIPTPGVRNVSRNEVGLGFVYNFGSVAGR